MMRPSYLHPNRGLDLGPLVEPEGVTYRVWAMGRQAVEVRIDPVGGGSRRVLPLQLHHEGHFSVLDPAGRAGDLYKFSVDGGPEVPDFISHYQPQGVMGPSMIIDPAAYRWASEGWTRPVWSGQVIYECHLGTFTPEGTYRAALARLDHLVDLGVTALEIMPVAQSAGDRNWGYDGVMLTAPYHAYGTPDDFRALIDGCHQRGLAVILDIVFNHLGPEGNFSSHFSPYFFHGGKDSPWGTSFNVDGEHSGPVRDYLLQVMRYWLDDFRIDGFRMDATHTIHDSSEVHLLAQCAEIVHDRGGFIIAEDDRNARDIFEPIAKKGWGFDAAWSDDFHHVLRVTQTGERHYFYSMVDGTAEELARTLEQGWLYVGQVSPFHKYSRGTPCNDFPPERFVFCISNHDQAGNRVEGERLHHDIPATAYRAVSLFLCLVPYTPLIFMGQEWATEAPFHFFSEMPPELGAKIDEGRHRDFLHTRLVTDPALLARTLSSQHEKRFLESKLPWDELNRAPHAQVLALYRAGLHFRRELFGRGSPARETWHVEQRPRGVGLHYRLNGRAVAVQFSLRGETFAHDHARVLLDSDAPAFGGPGVEPDGPRTLVLDES